MHPSRLFADQYEGNNDPNLAAYAHAGHCLYAHKATEGVFHADQRHAQRSTWAGQSGLTVMHYHFCRPDEGSPAKEAAWFWERVQHSFAPGDMLALDFERAMPHHASVVSADYIQQLYNETVLASGLHPRVYGSTSFLETYVRRSWLRFKPRWQAAYGPPPRRAPWGTAEWAWQFTDGEQGPVPHVIDGIGRSDISILNPRTALVLRARTARRRRAIEKKAR